MGEIVLEYDEEGDMLYVIRPNDKPTYGPVDIDGDDYWFTEDGELDKVLLLGFTKRNRIKIHAKDPAFDEPAAVRIREAART